MAKIWHVYLDQNTWGVHSAVNPIRPSALRTQGKNFVALVEEPGRVPRWLVRLIRPGFNTFTYTGDSAEPDIFSDSEYEWAHRHFADEESYTEVWKANATVMCIERVTRHLERIYVQVPEGTESYTVKQMFAADEDAYPIVRRDPPQQLDTNRVDQWAVTPYTDAEPLLEASALTESS